jgi:arginine/lysine/ornithine decarboxylase
MAVVRDMRREGLEEAAEIADKEADRIMRLADKAHRKEKNYDLYEAALEMMQAVVADSVARKIRNRKEAQMTITTATLDALRKLTPGELHVDTEWSGDDHYGVGVYVLAPNGNRIYIATFGNVEELGISAEDNARAFAELSNIIEHYMTEQLMK